MKKPNVQARILGIALLILLPSMLFGQAIFRGVSGHARFGGSMLELGQMNQFLENENYPLMSERPLSLELGMTYFYRDWLIGGDLNNFFSAQSRFRASQVALASLNYHYFNLYLGRILYRKDLEYMLYPTIGIAGGGAVLKYQPLGLQYPDSYWTGGFFLDGALHFSRMTLMADTPLYRIHWGFSIGARYGLEEQLPNTWQLKGLAADTIIPVRPTGVYVKFTFGMSKMGRRY